MQNRQASAPYRQRPDSAEFQLVRAKVRAADGTPQEAVAFFRTALAEKRTVSFLTARPCGVRLWPNTS